MHTVDGMTESLTIVRRLHIAYVVDSFEAGTPHQLQPRRKMLCNMLDASHVAARSYTVAYLSARPVRRHDAFSTLFKLHVLKSHQSRQVDPLTLDVFAGRQILCQRGPLGQKLFCLPQLLAGCMRAADAEL